MLADPQFAQDKRTIDPDGRLHVPDCRISKANVCGYYGREIPSWKSLNLDPDRIYQMYRTPELLQAAAASFNNIPLMIEHVPVSAAAPAVELIAGTVSNPRYIEPYLVADVSAWTQEARDGIENHERKELSCAYRYVASMIAGTSPDGVRYDGSMIPPGAANHVALVAEGRAGRDVLVADGAPRMTTKTARFPKIMAALSAVFAAVGKPEQAAEALGAMDSALSEELAPAEDAFPGLSADEMRAACDSAMKTLGKDSLTDEEKRDAYQRAAKDKAMPPEAKPPGASDEAIKLAVDAALVNMVPKAEADKMANDAAAAASASVHALFAAREAVEGTAGVVALDSAEGVYRFALDKLNIAHKDVPAAALGALYEGVKNAPALAADAALPRAAAPQLNEMFSTGHIRR